MVRALLAVPLARSAVDCACCATPCIFWAVVKALPAVPLARSAVDCACCATSWALKAVDCAPIARPVADAAAVVAASARLNEDSARFIAKSAFDSALLVCSLIGLSKPMTFDSPSSTDCTWDSTASTLLPNA